MKRTAIRSAILTLMLIFTALFPAKAQEYQISPISVQIPLFLKILAFEMRISSQANLTVYVVGSSEFANELKKKIGETIGKAKLAGVTEGSEIPPDKPAVIYVGDVNKLSEIVGYTRENKVLSITGYPDFVTKGVTLGIGVAGGKPKILLNISSSKAEGAKWNPVIMKVCTIMGQSE